MSNVTIWHNPRCTKSRQALALLRDRGIEPEIVEYLKTPPSEADIRSALGMLDLPAPALLRRREAAEAGLGADSDAEAVIAAMVKEPALIERPVVIRDGRAVIGRPTEAIEALFD